MLVLKLMGNCLKIVGNLRLFDSLSKLLVNCFLEIGTGLKPE